MLYSEHLVCYACSHEYDYDNYIPRLIPSCRHSLCSNCLENLLSQPEPHLCPIDGKPLSATKQLQAFPINIPLKEMNQKDPQKPFCQTHGKDIEIICLTEKREICESCKEACLHQNHNLRPLDQIKTKIDRKIDDFQNIFNHCEKYPKLIQIMLEEEELNLTELVKSKFAELRETLEKREELLLAEIRHYAKTKRGRMNETLQKDIDLKRTLNEKIMALKNNPVDEKTLDILKETGCQAFSKTEFFLLKSYLQTFSTQKFKKKIDSFCTQMTSGIKQFQFPFSSQVFLQRMQLNFISVKNNQEVFTSNELVEFEKDAHKLLLSIKETATPSELPIEKLEEITELELNLMEYPNINLTAMWDQIILTISYLWQSLKKAVKLTIKFQAGPRQPKDLLYLLDCEFWDDRKVKTRCDISGIIDEPRLVELVSEVLPKLPDVKEIRLHLKWQNRISDRSIEALIKNHPATLNALNYFSFVLDGSLVTDQSISSLLSCLSALRVFKLHLWKTKITDETLKRFASSSLPNMKFLQHFEMSLIETAVTDDGVEPLFVPMENIRIFKLYLEQTKVTNQSIQAFSNITLPAMPFLEALEFNVRGTLITNDFLVQALSDLKTLNHFKLYLNQGVVIDSLNKLENLQDSPNKSILSRIFKK